MITANVSVSVYDFFLSLLEAAIKGEYECQMYTMIVQKRYLNAYSHISRVCVLYSLP